MKTDLLEVRDLRTSFYTDDGEVKAVDGVSFKLSEGNTLGIVGESGSGKSITALSILKLLANNGKIVGGEIIFKGENLLSFSDKQMREIRGNAISMIFQEPMTSLNPVFTVGQQISESLMKHQDLSKKTAYIKSIELLKLVGIPSPDKRVKQYPYELSGGMRQRVMIAMALACNPEILIADEPTTALDVTIQAQILRLIRDLQKRLGMSVIMITHDLGVVAETCEYVAVMYAGQVVEYSDVVTLFQKPKHPYTIGLMNSLPRHDVELEKLESIRGNVPNPKEMPGGCRFAPRCPAATDLCRNVMPDLLKDDEGNDVRCWIYSEKWEGESEVIVYGEKELLKVEGLKQYFPIKGGMMGRTVNHVKAVDDISFTIYEGETVSIVGESGCGKSTTGRAILRLEEPTEGVVTFNGQELTSLSKRDMRKQRKDLQIIFQDPYASINPRQTVADVLDEAMAIQKVLPAKERRARIIELLETVGLNEYQADRYPHEFSGGQRQRIGIARALSVNPKLIICDEAVSALDVSIQAQVLNLLKDLQREFKLTYLFISHDLGVVRHISDRVIVMYLGKIVEVGDKYSIFENPKHPYTKALLSAIPVPDPTREKKHIVLTGDVPSPIDPPSGCRFHTRCPFAQEKCKVDVPALRTHESMIEGHKAACHFVEEIESGELQVKGFEEALF